MAEQNRPNQSANQSKSEGDRWSSDENTIQNAVRDEAPEQQYDERGADDAGGITNRPLSEEINSQEDVPTRGAARVSSGDPDAAQPEGIDEERDR